jgi:hypothetical protein
MSKSLEARLQALEDREEIARLKARYCQLNDGGWNGPTHAHVDEVVDLFVEDAVWDGDTATGNWHAIIPGTDAQKQALWTFGLYKETYVRTPQGWRFNTVTFEPAANAPYDQGWGKSQFFAAAQPFESHL